MEKKKYGLAVIFMLLFLYSIGITKVFASTSKVISIGVDGYYFERISDSKYDAKRFHEYSFTNGEIAYCIEPGVDITNEIYEVSDDITKAPFSRETMELVELIGYYGYPYYGHDTIRYRIATQELIWRAVSDYQVIWHDQRDGKGNVIDLTYEKNEIMALVNQHKMKPAFDNEVIYVPKDQVITLHDDNKVLDNYELVSRDSSASISNNTLSFELMDDETTIQMVRKKPSDKMTLIYTNSGQTMASFGINNTYIMSRLKVKALKGKVTLHKMDADTLINRPRGSASLKDAIYDIYTIDNVYVASIRTDEMGIGQSEELDAGEYYLKEKESSKGYKIDPNNHYFTIDNDNPNPVVEVLEKVIDQNIHIYKTYGREASGNLLKEPNITFEFYLNNRLYQRKATDKEGYINLVLPYGKYTVKQINTTTNYEKVADFEINIDENSASEFTYLLNDNVKKAYLKIIKIDKETNDQVFIKGIKFKIKDTLTDKYVCQLITYPSSKNICEFETDAQGVLITPQPLEMGRYIIEEKDQKITGYLWNSEKYTIDIKEDDNLKTDKKLGLVYEVMFLNQKVVGEITINKLGEQLVLKDNKYFYEDIPLSNVQFGLYAKGDIVSKTKQIVYKDKELVKSFTTSDGQYKITSLPLGSYCLVELATIDTYILNDTPHCFTLKYQNQYEPIVQEEITLKNYLPKMTLRITKKDYDTQETIMGTKIGVYNMDDELIYLGETSENGQIELTDLPYFDGYIKETEASEGYQLINDKMDFKASDTVIDLEMTNQKIPVPNTSSYDYTVIYLAILLCGAFVCRQKS